ncbi:hypothetical protein ACTMTI_21150 [Nonomuraea sp. H19]|jgi:hypothetical protein|uniref:hypothetical protein n=1 Tax=Nonomuraea sp. H19 TaxID=3452206 RepID=UPI003F888673
MLRTLHKMGIRSSHMYVAGAASVGLSFMSWLTSKQVASEGLARADRWGIFIGEWAPTFIALGVGLAVEETRDDLNITAREEIRERVPEPVGM